MPQSIHLDLLLYLLFQDIRLRNDDGNDDDKIADVRSETKFNRQTTYNDSTNKHFIIQQVLYVLSNSNLL